MPWPHCHFSRIAPEDLPGIRLGNVPDQLRCTAKAKSTGERCQNPRVRGKGICRLHGAGGKKLQRSKMLRQAARLRGERPAHWED
jgi:hypothetical protein